MTLKLNEEAPNFTADSTHGEIDFHTDRRQLGHPVSHPKDFTPVCTTELGQVANMEQEFVKRNCKVIGLSVDSVESHVSWEKDIEEIQGARVSFPMIGIGPRRV